MNKIQIAAFSVLHAIGALLLPFLISLLGGCVEPELVNKPGPSIPCEDIQSAINASFSGPFTFQVGEFAYFQATAAPVNQPAAIVEELTFLVTAVTPVPGCTAQVGCTNVRVTETKDYRDPETGQPTRDTSEVVGGVPNTYTICNPNAVETHHNYSASTGKMPVPLAPGDTCDARFVNCQMNITTHRYDKLITLKSGEQFPVHYQLITSNEVPYLSRMIQECFTYPVDADGRKIPVTRCNTIKNFKFKSP